MIAPQNTHETEMGKKRPSYETGSYRLQVRLPEDWKDALESAAAKAGITSSEFVRRAIRDKLPKRAKDALGDVNVGRPPKEEE